MKNPIPVPVESRSTMIHNGPDDHICPAAPKTATIPKLITTTAVYGNDPMDFTDSLAKMHHTTPQQR